MVPSKFATWKGTTSKVKNITLDNILEDIIFKQSNNSYFLQLVDFCAYSLLMHESKLFLEDKYNISDSFLDLDPVCFKLCNLKDTHGVIR